MFVEHVAGVIIWTNWYTSWKSIPFGRNNTSRVLARWHDQARGAGVNKPSASSRSALEILFVRYRRYPLEETTTTNPLDVRKRRQSKLLSQVNNKLGGICPPKLTRKYAHQ